MQGPLAERGPDGTGVDALRTDAARSYRRALRESLRLHQGADPEHVICVFDELVIELVGRMDGVVMLVAPAGFGELRPLGTRRFPAERGADMKAWLSRALEAKDPVELPGLGGRESLLSLPLMSDSVPLGAVTYRVPRSLSDDALEILILLARHAGQGIFRALRLMQVAVVDGAVAEVDAGGLSLREARRTFERRLLVHRLCATRGNVAMAARSLEMDRGQLSRMVRTYAIDRAHFRGISPATLPGRSS